MVEFTVGDLMNRIKHMNRQRHSPDDSTSVSDKYPVCLPQFIMLSSSFSLDSDNLESTFRSNFLK